ncbi:hypothetical protein AAL_03552 [Moelleriella libera RCEF 2490]|uniref:BZIP domain-containing protein n=1 Tax=Moelleriella libera RCEF 2490 TaxID=1081109 RepID=A0A168DC49_9HYPO|nr:hypothetical protein AAL_03552 [Moelleriella libera RCEF 2490]
MSQRLPGTGPVSCRSPPPATAASGADLHLREPIGSDLGAHDAAADGVKSESGRKHQASARSLGMLSILNPTDSQSLEVIDRGNQGPGPSTNPSPFFGAQGLQRQAAASHSAATSYSGTPIASQRSSTASLASVTEGLSTTWQLPGPGEPRKTSSPRMFAARTSVLGPSTSRPGNTDMPTPGPAAVVPPANRPHEYDMLNQSRLLPSLHRSGLGHAHQSAGAGTPKFPTSLSQPRAQPHDPTHIPNQLAGARKGTDSQFVRENANFQPGPPSAPIQCLQRPADGSQSWADIMRRSGLGASGVLEGQQAYMTLPGNSVPIPVQVDYSQASRKADEKRQRNAKASTRHRRKKKTMQEENVRQLQDVKEERQQLVEELEYTKHQRDFYREERNRLRDVVLRVPSLHHHAAGPPSPTPTRSTGSHTEPSPVTRHATPATASAYPNESLTSNRSSQQLMAEERQEVGGLGFVPTVSIGSLTSLANHGNGVMAPRPRSAASSGGRGEILPPLRAVEGPLPSAQHIALGHAHEQHGQDARTGQWHSLPPGRAETGWAVAPRGFGNSQSRTHQW